MINDNKKWRVTSDQKNNKIRIKTSLKYVVYKEDNYYVSQCLDVDVSSFGDNNQDAIDNLNEAIQLYFEDN